jgi:hypothetical protein
VDDNATASEGLSSGLSPLAAAAVVEFLLSSSRYPSVARPLHQYFVPFATDPLPLLNMLGLLRSLFVGTGKNSLASQSKANSLDMLGLLRWGLRCAFFVNLLFIFFLCLFQLESV